ncbi:MAG TPA: U32 family peptidase [Candidatus Limiplasma sp.]|nr:U32 family peptidase [Candidatus Limiplasma sp.]HPS81939.1 U32 family peptidase [Candidatus Limiplasma sp.]
MTAEVKKTVLPELLAPAGGMEQLKAALRFGADAVYGGLQNYGLRASATNFTPETLALAVEWTHRQGKRFYVTMNLLPFDRDMSGYLETAEQAARAGVDAAIVSDLGAAVLLRQTLPNLALHISTQANVLNTPTALQFQAATGCTRIVLSREMSLEDIRAMRENLPPALELETFVHGAMCVAYSGRCLLSAALTGRSANRGECAQPCRWPFHVVGEKRSGATMPVDEGERGTYLFSAYDLCMLEHLPELMNAGVASFKIEGRMKTAYYVATVVSAYRQAMDLLAAQGETAYRQALPALKAELNKASHRVSNTGFFFGAPQPAAGAEGFEQTMEFVAEIASDAAANEPAEVIVKNRFYVGDRLEALTPEGSKVFTVGSITLAETGESAQTVSVAGLRLRMAFPFAVGAGDLLRGPNRNHQKQPAR